VVLKVVVAMLLLVPLSAGAAEITCKKSPALTGTCSTIKGSLGLTSNIGVTLDSEDGRRFIIKAPPDSNADIAPVVMQNWLYWQTRTNSMKTRITGSFEICPLPSAINMAGIKDYGCINKGTHITQDKASSPGN
jgi:hypothetical protein